MRLAIICILVIASAAPAWAHQPSDARLTLVPSEETLAGRLEIAVRDLDAALVIDDGDGALTWRELVARRADIERYVAERVFVADDASPCPITVGTAALVEHSSGVYWSQPIAFTCRSSAEAIFLTYQLLFDVDALHRGLIRIGEQVLIARDGAPLRVALDAPTSLVTFLREGIWHIWIGFDHVLFLLCLLLPAVRARNPHASPAPSLRAVIVDVLEVVTAFTVAHSITLVISTLGIVTLPARLVETAIALSIVAAALNNVTRAIDARWTVAFVLGLLHGFGFSSVLLDLGLPPQQVMSSLLGFNLGVEIGQLVIVACVLPVLYVIRRTRAYPLLLWGGSLAAGGLGLLWAYERLAT